jgi:hypothetical protein
MFFWDVTPCSRIEVHRRFEGMCSLYLQGLGPIRALNQQDAGSLGFVVNVLSVKVTLRPTTSRSVSLGS